MIKLTLGALLGLSSLWLGSAIKLNKIIKNMKHLDLLLQCIGIIVQQKKILSPQLSRIQTEMCKF